MKYITELKSVEKVERFIRWYAGNYAGVDKVTVEFKSSQDAASFAGFIEQSQSDDEIYGTFRTL